MKNVALVVFDVESEAFEAFAELKNNAAGASYTVEEAGVLRNDGEGGVLVDTFGDDSVDDDVAFGGLIGALVGLLGGPFGVLLGGSIGLFAGGIAGESADDRNSSLLSLVAGKLGSCQAGIVALVDEEDTDGFDANFENYNVGIYRWTAAEIAQAVKEEKERRAQEEKADKERQRADEKAERELKREAKREAHESEKDA